jgi:ectoine hydroxylase-related dioxygenase (phytanoyl-CoA dioxygenase family)
MMRKLEANLELTLRRELDTDGATCVRHALTSDELSILESELEICLQDEKQQLLDYGSNRKVVNGFFLWTRSDSLKNLICHSSLPMIAAQLMGSNKINLFCDNLFLKEPTTPNHLSPWHSDQQHWIVKGHQVITFWLALDYVTKDSGALQFIRGSHLWDLSREGYYRTQGEYEPISELERKRHMFDIFHYDLAPGDMTAHYGMTLHYASGNHTTDRRRRGYAIRYTGDDVVYEPNPSFETPMPVNLVPGAALDSPLFPICIRPGA